MDKLPKDSKDLKNYKFPNNIRDVKSLVMEASSRHKETVKKNLQNKTLVTFQKQIASAFYNDNRRNIIILCYAKGYNITQVSEELGLHYNIAFAHVKFLEKLGFVKIDPQKHKKNKPSIVTTTEEAWKMYMANTAYAGIISNTLNKIAKSKIKKKDITV